jgi:hypothetical protein
MKRIHFIFLEDFLEKPYQQQNESRYEISRKIISIYYSQAAVSSMIYHDFHCTLWNGVVELFFSIWKENTHRKSSI